MYCPLCEDELSSRARFCKRCGTPLVRRSNDELLADLTRHRFLLAEIERWKTAGTLAGELADKLAAPYQTRLANLQAALEGGAPPLTATRPASAVAPPAVQASAPVVEAQTQAAAEVLAPTSVAVELVPATAATEAAEPAARTDQPLPQVAETAKERVEVEAPASAPDLSAAPADPKPSPQALPQVPLPGAKQEPGEAAALLLAASGHGLDLPEPELTPEQQVIERESSWDSTWKPFLYENVGWFVGAFFLLAGSFYLVAESEGGFRTLVVSGFLALYSVGFCLIGRHLIRSRSLTTAGRVLASIAGALAPMILLAVHPLSQEGLIAGALGTTAALGIATGIAWASSGLFGTAERAHFTLSAALLLVLFAALGHVTTPSLAAGAMAGALAILYFAAPMLGRLREDRGHAAFAGIGLAWFALVVFVRGHYEAEPNPDAALYGPLATAFVAVALRAERKLFASRESPSALVLLAYCALVPACLVSLSARASFAVACAVTALLVASGARAYRSRVFTGIALVVGWLSFHALGGLFKPEWLLAFRELVAGSVGYSTGKALPYNYGGLVSLFYLAGLVVLYHRAKRAGAEWALSTIRGVILALTVFLVGWSHLGSDLRPAALTVGVVAAGALALSYWLASPKLALISAIATLILGFDLGVCLGSGRSVLLGYPAGLAVVLFATRALDKERARYFSETAFLASLLSFLLVLVAPIAGGWFGAVTLFLTALLGLDAARLHRTRVLSTPALGTAVAAILVAAHVAGAPDWSLSWIAMALGFLFIALSGAQSRSPGPVVPGSFAGSPVPFAAAGFDLIREPAAWIGGLSCTLSLLLAIDHLRHPGLLLFAFAIACFAYARRFAWIGFAVLGGLVLPFASSTLYCGAFGWPQAALPVAGTALVLALFALALARSERLAQLTLRQEASDASKVFVLCGTLAATVSVVLSIATPASRVWASLPLALAAATFLTLARTEQSQRWLYPGFTLAAAALASPLTAGNLPLLFSLLALGHLGLAYAAGWDPQSAGWRGSFVRFVHALVGTRPDKQGRNLTFIAHLHAVAAVVAGFGWIDTGWQPEPLQQAAPALALFYLLAPRLDRFGFWLVLSGISAWASVALSWPLDEMPLSWAAFAVGLLSLSAVAKAWPQAAGAVLRTRRDSAPLFLGATGLFGAALAATGLVFLDDPSAANTALLLGLALALAPRTFSFSLFLPPAAVAALYGIALHLAPELHAPMLAIAGLSIALLALLCRRLPVMAKHLFTLEDGRTVAQALVIPAMAAAVAAIACHFLEGNRLLPLEAVLGLAAATYLVSHLATRWSTLLVFVVSFSAAAAFAAFPFPGPAFLAASAVVNLTLLLVGQVPPEGTRWLSPRERSVLLGTSITLACLGLLFVGALAATRWAFTVLGFEPRWATAMLAAQLFTSLHQLRRHPFAFSWHLLLLTVVTGLWLEGGPEAWPFLASAAALVLALAEYGLTRERGAHVLDGLGLSRGANTETVARLLGLWTTVLALAAPLTTGFQAADPATSLSLGVATAAMAMRSVRGSSAGRFLLCTFVPATLHFALFYLGIQLSTGRPEETILPFLATAMALAAIGAERLGTWKELRGFLVAAHLYALLAVAEWSFGLGLTRYVGLELWASSSAILLLTAFCVLRGKTSGSEAMGVFAHLGLLALYLSLRVQTEWVGGASPSDADALAGLVFGFLFLGLHVAVRRTPWKAFHRPSRWMALLVPIAGLFALEREASLTNAGLLFAVAVQLTAHSASQGRGKLGALLAAVAYNGALMVLWLDVGIGGAGGFQFYVIPAGVSLIVLGQLYKAGIGPLWHGRLRSLGMVAIYVSSIYPALVSFQQPSYAFWCAFLCLLGVAAGVALRVRAYLYLGTAFLVTCIVGNFVRHGLQDHRLGAALLLTLGFLVLGFMGFFSVKREELLRRYKKVQALLAEWQ